MEGLWDDRCQVDRGERLEDTRPTIEPGVMGIFVPSSSWDGVEQRQGGKKKTGGGCAVVGQEWGKLILTSLQRVTSVFQKGD